MSMSSDEESQVATEALGQSPSTATKLSIPTGISAPKVLKREGNLATNWKKIKIFAEDGKTMLLSPDWTVLTSALTQVIFIGHRRLTESV